MPRVSAVPVAIVKKGAASVRFRGDKLARRTASTMVRARNRLPEGSGVALTFDDGPHPELTPSILDLLADRGATATFFCLGKRVEENPALVKRIVDEGHSVGSHSHTHRATRDLGPLELARDLRRGHRAVERAIGRSTRLFRPPNSYIDLKLAATTRLSGMETWLWTIDSNDWNHDSSVEDVVSACASMSSGDVIVMHDHPGVTAPPERVAVAIESTTALIERIHAVGLRTARLAM